MDELQTQPTTKERGQALVEYALILVLLAIGLGFAIAATGPAIGNVFSNVIYNVVGTDPRQATPLSLIGGNPVNFWQTVTWVAANPQTETPFPTPVIRPPTEVPAAFQSPTPSNTPTRTQTPTNTSSPTNTATLTATNSSTPGPSPTPPDNVFTLPHVDQMGNPQWWRVAGNTPYLGNEWLVQWYNGLTPNSGSANFTLSNPVNSGTIGPMNYSGSWGSGYPAGTGITDGNTWGAIFSRSFRLTSPMTVIITTLVDDYARVRVNGTTILAAPQAATGSTTYTFNANTDYVLEVWWGENTGGAAASITFVASNAPDETVPGCSWQAVNRGDDTNSRAWMFAQSASNNVYAASQVCYLELRGYVEIGNAGANPKPILSFWDYWDLPANMVAELQISPYVEQTVGAVPPVLNRSGLTWTTISVRNGGTANYQWTRNEIDLRTAPVSLGASTKVTFRFVLRNTAASAVGSGVNMRWFVDDIQLINDVRSDQFITVDASYNLDSMTQRGDFYFNSDSNYTIEANGGVPAQVNGSTQYRWNLTNERDGGADLAWDDSPGGNHAVAISDSPSGLRARVQTLEFRPWVDLRPAVAPSPDAQGLTGPPLLTFWTSYEVGSDVQLEVQYSRAARHDIAVPSTASNPDNWTTIDQDGVLKRSAGCTLGSTCFPNERPEATGSSVLTWRLITIRLNRIPDWDTQRFRLRFAMTVPGTNTARGWYIDDINIVRDTSSRYMAYPFFDGAEGTEASIRTNWNLANGTWAATGERGGHDSTGLAFSDTPNTNYAPNMDTTMELRRIIDLNFDTPENTGGLGGVGEPVARPPASKPKLTFWHLRDLNSNDALNVDLWLASTNTWTNIWRITPNNQPMTDTRGLYTQNAWERVEIDLETAVLSVTGIANWSTLTSNASTTDDDIRIRFRMQSSDSSVGPGVYIDNIRIENFVELTHRLWTGVNATYGTGDGEYLDSVETATRTVIGSSNWVNPTDWRQRWYAGGGWSNSTAGGEFARSGSQALHDSISGNYGRNEEHILELVPIIDLRGTTAANRPRMYFWTRYNLEDDDRIRVQIATENTSSTTQGHEKLARFNAWAPDRAGRWRTPAPLWQRVAGDPSNNYNPQLGAPERRDTWQRYVINLEPYVGQRIRVRFMLDTDSANNVADGWYLDDIQFLPSTINPITVSPIWNGNQIDAWVREGSWGTTQQYFRGSGSNAADLGPGQWIGYFYDCEILDSAAGVTGSNICDPSMGRWGSPVNTYQAILYHSSNPLITGPTLPDYDGSTGRFGPVTTQDINYWFDFWRKPQKASGAVAPDAFYDTYMGRFYRNVSMSSGIYTFQTIANDGVRVRISDRTNIQVNGVALPAESPLPYGYTNSGLLINRWAASGTPGSSDPNVLDTVIVNVTAGFTNRAMTVEFFEQDDDATIQLNATRNAFSFTDSPNTPSGTPGGYTTVNSIRYGNSSLLLNGYFDLTGTTSPTLTYYRLWNFVNNQALYVEASADGGFTWWNLDTHNPGTNSRLPPTDDWLQVTADLPANTNYVMIRFRLDTYSVGGGNPRDGVYITDITVAP
jgi:Flp pilus assembly pilin Flp